VMARREESDDDWKVEGKVESDGKGREIELPVRILDATKGQTKLNRNYTEQTA
jgi:hypothetical protein